MLAIDGHLQNHASSERGLKRLVSEAVQWLSAREPLRERESAVPTSGRRPRLRDERPAASRR
jgi:hypothetical protein